MGSIFITDFMTKKHQIFISSTFTDLKEERQAAVEAVLAAGHIPAGMELFAAGDESQMEVIQRWIDDSDVYMLILGGRYGSTHPRTGKSYTEHEYEYALESGKPFFALVLTEESIITKAGLLGDGAIEQKAPEKLAAFREKVLSKISKLVDDCKDIKIGVLESVRLLEKKYSLHGWVRSDTQPNISPLLQQMSALTEENALLKTKLAAAPVNSLGDGSVRLADLEDQVNVRINFKTSYNGYDRDVTETLTWNGIFSLVSPKLLAGQADDFMKHYIAGQILEQKGLAPYSAEVLEQDFHSIKIHLMAINLIRVEYSSTIKGGAALFWNLTELGRRTMLELRAARK